MRHYTGYGAAVENVRKMTLTELLDHIDDLFGRSELAHGATEEDVRAEALRQTEIEWRDTSEEAQRENSLVEFHIAAAKAMREASR